MQQTAQAQSQWLDLYRSSLKTMNDVMKTSLETTERLHNQQLQQVRSALEETTRSTGELTDVHSLDQLMALQGKLAGSQLQRTLDFWGSIWRAAGDSHIALISQMQTFSSQVAQDATRLATSQISSASDAANAAMREAAAQQQERHRKAG
jgi:Phasin protein